ncbi:MAG TPA: hypothetical protein VKB34_13560 [Povalibacter sp.]|nr:hypothetical protein [Povalibacter sp.]
MSLEALQCALVRLIADPSFRDAVRAGCLPDLATQLTPLERSRLESIAADRGLDVNRTLHRGFRLTKLRGLLPLTCEALGSRRLGAEATAFWQVCPPTSFYFLPEALEFCEFLASRRRLGKYVREVMAYERAHLELQRARRAAPPSQRVHFRHDPAVLLATLAAGRRPRSIPLRDCIATATLRDGEVEWQIEDTGPLSSAGTPHRLRSRPGALRSA